MKPTQKEIKGALFYDRGRLRWIVPRKRGDAPWAVAGNNRPDGYVRIKLYRKLHMAHALIWIYHYGDIPEGLVIDHINGDPSDNQIENLRVGTRAQNMANVKTQKDTITGLKGVFRRSQGSWRAHIRVRGKRINLGSFTSPEEAKAAYDAAAKEHFGEFVRAG